MENLRNTFDQSYRDGEAFRLRNQYVKVCKLCNQAFTAIVVHQHCGQCQMTKTSDQRDLTVLEKPRKVKTITFSNKAKALDFCFTEEERRAVRTDAPTRGGPAFGPVENIAFMLRSLHEHKQYLSNS